MQLACLPRLLCLLHFASVAFAPPGRPLAALSSAPPSRPAAASALQVVVLQKYSCLVDQVRLGQRVQRLQQLLLFGAHLRKPL